MQNLICWHVGKKTEVLLHALWVISDRFCRGTDSMYCEEHGKSQLPHSNESSYLQLIFLRQMRFVQAPYNLEFLSGALEGVLSNGKTCTNCSSPLKIILLRQSLGTFDMDTPSYLEKYKKRRLPSIPFKRLPCSLHILIGFQNVGQYHPGF